MKTHEFKEKILTKGIDQRVADLFISYLTMLNNGDLGQIEENQLAPLPYGSLPHLKDLPPKENKAALEKVGVLKLNGGLGTSMGLSAPKSFLNARSELRFIDIIAGQVQKLRSNGAKIPLVLMNSAVTEEQTNSYLASHPELHNGSVPSSFCHHSFPKVLKSDLSPAEFPKDSTKEWNPAGHGDIYCSLNISGTLDQLIESGIEYLFISNSDNLGATLDPKILNYVVENQIPFLMEVCKRREMDKKGGHLAKDKATQGLLLRERAQAKKEDIAYFEDISKYSYFNSNSLWIHLPSLKEKMGQKGTLPLPFIANEKHLNPIDNTSPKVYQLETAMGSAISLFPGAQALEIPQERFRPVKKYDDLLLLWSDRFQLDQDFNLVDAEGCSNTINIELDPEYFGTYDEFYRRIGQHLPSLKHCTSLIIKGDVSFANSIKLEGDCHYEAKPGEPLIIK